jgi:tRNA threonylcarbamoyladenosine biosynthesis protein TsaB
MTASGFEGRVLAIETSGELAGIALTASGRLLGEAAIDSRISRTETLLESARRLLGDLRLTPGDLDLIAYDEGPGSFTGLRVGMAAALGLAAGADRPVVGVPSLEVLAYPFRQKEVPIAVVSGCRRGLIYAAVYRWVEDSFQPALAPSSAPIEEALSRIAGVPGERLLFVGDALDSLAEAIRNLLGHRGLLGPVEPARAAHLAALATAPGRTVGAGRTLEGRTPLYLRDADARKPKRPA